MADEEKPNRRFTPRDLLLVQLANHLDATNELFSTKRMIAEGPIDATAALKHMIRNQTLFLACFIEIISWIDAEEKYAAVLRPTEH